LDTALALRALSAETNNSTGLSIVDETLAGSATSVPRVFNVPTGSANLTLQVRALTGSIRFQVTYPDSSGEYIDLSTGQAPLTVNLPIETGASTFTAMNLASTPGTYTAEVGFTETNGYDTFSITTPLTFLGLAQNSNGGWGIAAGQDSQFMVTCEVVRSLAAWKAIFSAPRVFSSATAWIETNQNADGGFSWKPGASSALETGLAMLAIHAAEPNVSLTNEVAYLTNAELPDGSWGGSAYQTALVMQALRILPVVSQIPGQSVVSPAPFAAIDLTNYVTDAGAFAGQITWQVTGNVLISVTISNQVATLVYPPGTNLTEQLTFTATDPNGYSASCTATFAAVTELVGYSIAQGGSVNGSSNILAAQSVLSQAAYFTQSNSNVPPGVTYTTESFSISSPTTATVGFNIAASPSAVPGYYSFSIIYGLENAESQPLGPLTNNIFNFSIRVTP
jgi:hypothetical protein